MRPGDGTPGPGRPKGSVNKASALLKDMILTALTDAGGVEYLARQAKENPGPFLALVGKVLPMQLNHSGSIEIPSVHYEAAPGEEIDLTRILAATSKTVQ